MNGLHSENGKQQAAPCVSPCGPACRTGDGAVADGEPAADRCPSRNTWVYQYCRHVCAFKSRKTDALAVALLKAFSLGSRGVTAGTLSLTGGLAALGVMTLVLLSPKTRPLTFLSASPALFSTTWDRLPGLGHTADGAMAVSASTSDLGRCDRFRNLCLLS